MSDTLGVSPPLPSSPSVPPSLSISIVVYFPDARWLTTTLETLVASLVNARYVGAMRRAKICLVDNGAASNAFKPSNTSPFSAQLEALCKEFGWIDVIGIAGQGNIGYGRANNLAIARCAESDFHLVLNPDVKLAENAIANALRYLQEHVSCAIVSPVATAPDGQSLYLVKRFPDLFTLALRGFAPDWIRQRFRARLDAYEYRETPYDAPLNNVEIVSGCFMMMRKSALLRAEGFDAVFFLYFEDFDLSYRIAKFASVARVPDVRIVHAGGSAAAKGLRHVWWFVRSALRFHWKHG